METTRKCKCKLCTWESPFIEKVEAILPPELKEDWDKFISDKIHDSDDLCYYKSQIEGTWPGWEWLPAEIKRRRKLSKKDEYDS